MIAGSKVYKLTTGRFIAGFFALSLLTGCGSSPDSLTAPKESESQTQHLPVGRSTSQSSGEFPAQPEVAQEADSVVQEFPVPAGSRPHDVAPAPDGTVWYTAQRRQALGRLDPQTGNTHHIPLGTGSAPHGVIVGPNDGKAWVTDGGLNAIVSVDPVTEAVQVYPLPQGSGNANLNTATFDGKGVLWFTGQNGIYGRLDLAVGEVEVFPAPGGRGPYGITTTPDGSVYYASLAGSYVGHIDLESA
jgi:virginiamycin B lyase